MERDELYARHIVDAITAIEKYLGEGSHDEFLKNNLLQDGVIRQLEIIGEAAKNLSRDFKKGYKTIPWKDIIGMRDKLTHEYFGVDVEVVWETAKKNLEPLKSELRKSIERKDGRA